MALLAFTLTATPPLGADNGRDAAAPAQQSEMSESEREDILLRKTILMGFPAAAVGALIIAIVATRKQRHRRREQARQNQD